MDRQTQTAWRETRRKTHRQRAVEQRQTDHRNRSHYTHAHSHTHHPSHHNTTPDIKPFSRRSVKINRFKPFHVSTALQGFFFFPRARKRRSAKLSRCHKRAKARCAAVAWCLSVSVHYTSCKTLQMCCSE